MVGDEARPLPHTDLIEAAEWLVPMRTIDSPYTRLFGSDPSQGLMAAFQQGMPPAGKDEEPADRPGGTGR